MKKIEIIANLSVEDEVMSVINESGVKGFTKMPIVHGAGNTNPKMGTSVWPEENFMLIIYAEESVVMVLRNKIINLKEHFPHEGIKCFVTNVEHL